MIQDVGFGIFKDSSLMGTFTIPLPTYTPQTTPVFTITSEVKFPLTILNKSIKMMGSTSSDGTVIDEIQVQTSEGKEIHQEKLYETVSSTPLSTIEMSYQENQMASADLDQNPSPREEYDPYTSLIWDINIPNTHDLLDQTFSSDEAIMEIMNILE